MKKFDIIWIGIIINISILLSLVVYSFSNVVDSSFYNFLRDTWFLSFGWICGRLSR